jgi:lipopolysaccharide/colanic/teichoic acid biosynthesis glycosyltransferase
MTRTARVLKRAMDVLLSLWSIGVTSPLWLLCSGAVRLSSPGPILYRDLRVGRAGRTFRMYKFRTMRWAAESMGVPITGAGDERVTQVGRVLRTTKLDELPQLLNVLRGDMSLVGPRAEAPEYVNLADERHRLVLSVRPGITGPTQLRYRHEEKLLVGVDVDTQYRSEILPLKLESDLTYVATPSLWRDALILSATARRLLEF